MYYNFLIFFSIRTASVMY